MLPLILLPLPARAEIVVDCFRLRAPDNTRDIEQGSDLHYGRLGDRDGLWLDCDRNGRQSAGKIYLISPKTLQAAKPSAPIIADEEFTIVAPAEGWAAFNAANKGAGDEPLADLRRRVTPSEARGEEPFLDLEAITIAPSPTPPHEPRLFVVAEEPFSTVLELVLQGHGPSAQARLAAAYTYPEKPEEQGSARNDGLEGFAYAGRLGEFYFAEEATAPLNQEPRSLVLFSVDPRLGRVRLDSGRAVIDTEISDPLTAAIRKCRRGKMQTLNAITVLPDGRLLVVDRNGGWIDLVDPVQRTAQNWLNLYDLDGKSLRKVLDQFPEQRKMPYVSIEGLAFDPTGALWLIDDPAMPEGWRESCMVRLTHLPPIPASRPAP